MKYAIYQLTDATIRNYGFMSWSFAQKHDFKLSDYAKCYEGEVDLSNPNAALESLFVQFNGNRPEDFRGHSLSMSDVVALEFADSTIRYYYCDTFGWEDITSCLEEVA